MGWGRRDESITAKRTWHNVFMSTLSEIEEAADALPAEEKQELLLFLAARLRAQGVARREPRQFTREKIDSWIEQDEADMRRFSEQE
jgi:hypothetical protein